MTHGNDLNNILQMQGQSAVQTSGLSPLLSEDEKPVAETLNAGGAAPLILVCEHASNAIPAYFDNLGLSEAERNSHIAWDPGARNLALSLSTTLDAPLVCSRISRLVYDCNRPVSSPTAMPAKSEMTLVPGNSALSKAQIQARFEQIYLPFEYALKQTVHKQIAAHTKPALVTIHSFTPVYFGEHRAVEIGLLHGEDANLANAMLGASAGSSDLRIELNQPYGPRDGVSHTLDTHAMANGLPNIMIEVRNDLLAGPSGVNNVARLLEMLIRAALNNLPPSIREDV